VKKAVLFDLDGVLLDSMPYHVQAWQSVLSPLNVTIEAEDIYSREGTRTSELARELLRKYQIELSEQAIEKIVSEKSQSYNQISQARLMTGAIELIDDLKYTRVTCAIVTGSYRENLERVVPEDFLNNFDSIIGGGDVTAGKPDPQPYLLAARRVSLQPAECVVIENAALGVRSAIAAGMPCVAITSTQSAEQLREADLILADLQQVMEKLGDILMLGENEI
jgi:HAD superfamily hydrolase (TIGR01509 family)